jgi:CheY-like chemotaxis protein
VSDNGIGIGPDMLPHVFELFAQAQRTPDRSQGGLGLGLALVKSLVELHGGSVHAHSGGAQAGSAFTVRLPQVPCARAQLRDSAPSRLPGQAALRLMVVDDNADAAHMLRLLLEGEGYEVAVEHEAERAIERARTSRFDAFLLDIGLPGLDGRELAATLRREPNAGGALLVAITGYGQQGDRAVALASGFDEYFVKPVDIGALGALLTQSRQRQACPA